MSSFNKENNNINDERGEDTSFYSFLAGILILFVIHYFIKIYRRVFYKVKFDDENKYLNCHCSKCEERFKKYRLKIKSQNINIYLIFRILDFSVILSFFILCCIKVRNNDKERFDPFEILEISESSTLSEIKKSYKQLSLKYHPDKNPNNKEAKEKFMIVNKAYRALTNEKAKENFKKYGNPDGPGLISYGLALPFFLLEGKVGTYVLIIFSISMIIIFPLLFIRWFKNSKRYNNNGLLIENLPLYYKMLNKDISITHLPYIVGMSKEFEEMKIDYDTEEIKKIFKVFIPYFPKDANYENIPFKNLLAITLLYIHFSGSTVLIVDNQSNAQFNEELNKVLEKSIFLVDQIIKIIFELNGIYEFNKGLEQFIKKQKKGKTNKNDTDNDNDNIDMFQSGKFETYEIKEFSFNLVKTIIAFRARIFHETNVKLKNDELLQFPNNKNNLPIFDKNNYISIIDTVYEISNAKNKLKYLDNYKDIEEIINIMPKYKINAEILDTKFEGVGNLLTFNINIIRGEKDKINSNEQKELGYLHSNNYNDTYTEEIIIIIYDKNKKRINYFEKAEFEFVNEEKKIEYGMFAESEGKNVFEVYLFSLSFPGINIKQEISVEIKDKNNFYNNFIKNRIKGVLPQEEFEENYGILNEDNEKDINHEHQN